MKLKRLLSLFLCMVLLVSNLAVAGYATENETAVEETAMEEAVTEVDVAEEIPEQVMAIGDGDLGTGTPDGTPPVLHSITLSATTVKAPGTIEVTMDASDDVSGLDNGYIRFVCKETNKGLGCSVFSTYWDNNIHKEVPYADGKLHGTIEIDQYVLSGDFVIDYLYITDIARNTAYYYNTENDSKMPEAVKNLQFTVIESDTPDGTPPVLKDVKLVVNIMAAPGIIEVTMDASDDVSGLDNGYIRFVCKETNKGLGCSVFSTYWDNNIHKEVPYADGKLHGTIEIDQYVLSGDFAIDYLYITDIARNTAYYYNTENDSKMPQAVKNLQFTVLNAIPDVTTSVSKSEFVEQLEEAKDDAYIVADYSGNATLTEEAFEAIAGTDKTVDLVSEGVTWRFNGEDITKETKDIDLSVKITKAEEETSASGQEIKELLDDSAAVVLKFAENGELPGKATIQVKVDYAMREYLGSGQKLYVYYYNNQTGKLELVAEDLTVVNDTYVEFAITHCSYYVLTATKAEEKPEVKPEDKPEVKPVEFKDVPTDAFFYDAVMWAVENGVTTGTSATTFSPDEVCTRGQVVTFLWRAAGKPEPKNTTNPFTDVKEGDFFYKAVLWAVENKVTTGTGDGTTFAPYENCNRGQIVTFLSRAKGGKATTSTNPFKDVAENAFYYNPVLWAVEKGITTGTGDGTTFAPNEDCTRGQVITFLYRAYTK